MSLSDGLRQFFQYFAILLIYRGNISGNLMKTARYIRYPDDFPSRCRIEYCTDFVDISEILMKIA
jgi:hypothetical protein